MAIHNLDTGEKIHEFQLDLGTILSISGKHYHKELFYSFSSFLTPNIIHRVQFTDAGIEDTVRINEHKMLQCCTELLMSLYL